MPNEVMQGVDIATQAYNKLNARTAVLLYENTNAGIGNAKVFKETFEKLGGKVVAEIGFGRDVNDFTAIATRVAGLGKVDVIPTYTLEGQGLKITQALAQAGVVKGGGGPRDPARHHLAALRLRAEGRQGRGRLCAHRAVRPDRPARRWCATSSRAFKAKYNADPTHINAHAYDQIMLIADVVKRGAKDAQSIRDALAATKDFRRHRQRRVRQEQPEHQDGHDPLHGDQAGPVLEGLEVELTA